MLAKPYSNGNRKDPKYNGELIDFYPYKLGFLQRLIPVVDRRKAFEVANTLLPFWTEILTETGFTDVLWEPNSGVLKAKFPQ